MESEADYYDSESNVSSYIKFTPAHDGAELVDTLCRELKSGASVLEIGMGPGKDFKLLSQSCTATGSDRSTVFLNRYREIDPEANLLHLDARTLLTDRTFDAIFSNKALIHMSAEDLSRSFERQHQVLNEGGLIMHSFWYGEGENEFNGLTLVYHDEKNLREMLTPQFEILKLERHAKMSEGDSIFVLARRR